MILCAGDSASMNGATASAHNAGGPRRDAATSMSNDRNHTTLIKHTYEQHYLGGFDNLTFCAGDSTCVNGAAARARGPGGPEIAGPVLAITRFPPFEKLDWRL